MSAPVAPPESGPPTSTEGTATAGFAAPVPESVALPSVPADLEGPMRRLLTAMRAQGRGKDRSAEARLQAAASLVRDGVARAVLIGLEPSIAGAGTEGPQ